MKLLGTQVSPFVRIVRVLCAELNLDCTFEALPPFAKMTREDLAKITEQNPLMKIPVLLDGETTVIDSRFIAAYLLKEKAPDAKIKPLATPDEENILTVIYGIMDAGVLRFLLGAEGMDLNKGYLKKSGERIESGLVWLNAQESLGKTFSLCEITLLCALEWFTKRNIVEWTRFPALKALHEKYKDRPALVQTRIPESA